ncbi:MAG TPA: TonB-dependent receptor plug domain-containing protein, partial [Bacteroidales bacterium]|nr:TonB-dependent receptor plug domain-containing protein [Bacteroidales bacterium]
MKRYRLGLLVWPFGSALKLLFRVFFFNAHKLRTKTKTMKKVILLITSLLLVFNWQSFAQQLATGRLVDIETRMAVEGASIRNLDSGAGSLSLEDGWFSITLIKGKNTLEISHLGYEDMLVAIPRHRLEKYNLDVIALTSRIIGLEEISVIAALATDRRTPVASSTLPAQLIERNMGNQNFPEIMKRVPGVYATQTGGGTGDARLSIRGFQQENVALLLNGIPVSSFENGLVYWSNWAGLADATQTIQVQRGLGASKVATNSVGGTINIITRPAKAPRGGSIRYTLSDFGNSRIIVNLSSGLMDNGFAVQFLGSRTTGPGYADATHVDAWSYFLSLSRNLNPNHKLVFTALGSPERHGQRSHGLTHQQFTTMGNKYNPNWGYFNGRINSVNENFYHKPHISLNHYWNINATSTLMTAAYFSAGAGGGKFTQSFSDYPSTFAIRRNNQIDWDAIFLNNSTHNHTYTLDNGSTVSGFSKNIQTNYLATHYWVGMLTQMDRNINQDFNLTTGVHARQFKSRLRQEVSDLLGGQFWIEDYSLAAEGRGNRSQIKRKGDITGVDNGASIQYISGFSQLDYSTESWNIFAQATVS